MYLDQSPWITLSPESSAQPKLGLKQLISLCNPSRPGQAARVVNAAVNLDALVGCRSVVHNLQGGVAQGMGPCHLAAEALASCFRAIRPFAGFLQLRREARLKSCEPSLLMLCLFSLCYRRNQHNHREVPKIPQSGEDPQQPQCLRVGVHARESGGEQRFSRGPDVLNILDLTSRD